MSDQSDMQAVINTAQRAAQPFAGQPGEFYIVVEPDGDTHEVDLQRLTHAPRRKTGGPTIFTAAAFAAYVNRHKDERTTLWGDIEVDKVTAVIDDHSETSPGWGEHRATLVLRHPPAWRRWIARDGKMGRQEEFAEHIEASLPEIVEPDGATLLEIAQSFHARNAATFRSGTRLSSGEVQFRYEEQVEAAAGRQGELTVPERFTVALQPYEGAETYDITARLRYRVREGNLAIGYVLDRPEEALRAVFAEIVAGLATDTGLSVWEGSPRS